VRKGDKRKSSRRRTSSTEMAPPLPRASEAERVVVGAVLLGNDDPALTKLNSHDFFNSQLACVYSRLRVMQGQARTVDLPTVVDELRDHGELEDAGGAAFVSSLIDGLPQRLAMGSYVDAIREKALLRRLAHMGQELGDLAVGKSASPREIILAFERRLSDLRIASRLEERIPGDESAGEILDRTALFVRRFVAMLPAQTDIVSLWILHTHAFDAADVTGYLSVTSAEKRSGKTRLLEVLNLVVAAPWFTGRATPAVLVRKIHSEQPTLLLDESDTALRDNNSEYADHLRGVLNFGYRRGGVQSVCVGQGTEIDYKDFSAFCPKAIAGIGQLPDTVADRSFPIRLQRRAGHERVEHYRRSEIDQEAALLRDRIAAMAAKMFEILKSSKPDSLEELGDRQNEIAAPLLAIADAAGGDWSKRARTALLEIFSKGSWVRDESRGVRLLHDIGAVFDETATDQISTTVLLEHLNADESAPWCETSRGKPLTGRGLSQMLASFGIRPQHFRDGSRTIRGYTRELFRDAWERYCMSRSVGSGTTGTSGTSPIFNELAVPVKDAVSDVSGTNEISGTGNLLKINRVPDVPPLRRQPEKNTSKA